MHMEHIIDMIVTNVKAIDYQGPAAFVIGFLAILAFFRKFSILLITLLVIVLGWGAQDLIILNIKTQNQIVNLPLIVYGCGGTLVLVLVLITFYKS